MSAKISKPLGALVYSVLVLGVFAVVFCVLLSQQNGVEASTATTAAVFEPAATFAADGASLGAIPDSGTTPTCQNNSTTFRDVTFTISGLTGNVSTVSVNFNASHTFLQDLEVSLRAPGGAPSHLLFSSTGTTSTVANSCAGSANDLSTANTYTFADTATANWWTTAATNPVPTSTNRTVVAGPTSNPPATTSLNTTFAGLTPAQANGTWTLRFRDRGVGDTGTVTAANLTIETAGGPAVTDALADFDADGRTDYAVVRNVGGISGQNTWHVSLNQSGGAYQRDWGLGGDTIVPADFDGDGKDDIAIWRPGVQSTFYIIQSSTNTIKTEDFGLSSDDPSVVGDFNGNGTDDVAVYRAGSTPGSQSNWYWKEGASFNSVAWGLNGDFLAPGDYDGDGRMDYVVQRGNVFYLRRTTAGDTSVVFGNAGDAVVPGDYDGDAKTDLATMTPDTGNPTLWRWTYRPSLGGADVADTWGLVATDWPAPGDYNGDGKADYAVWRPGALSNFFIMTPVTRQITTRQWGLIDDIPATLTYSH